MPVPSLEFYIIVSSCNNHNILIKRFGFLVGLTLVFHLQKLKDVQEFLGLPLRDMRSRQVKIHTGPLWKQIGNWDEVEKTLRGTPYQNFLFKD